MAIAEFSSALATANWSDVYTAICNGDPNKSYSYFIKTYSDLFNIYFPEKTVKFSKKLTPRQNWITTGLMKSCHKKSILYKNYIKNHSSGNKARYNNYRNKLKTLLLKTERNYYQSKFESIAGNLHQSWKILRTILNKGHPTINETDFLENGTNVVGSLQIADKFNK